MARKKKVDPAFTPVRYREGKGYAVKIEGTLYKFKEARITQVDNRHLEYFAGRPKQFEIGSGVAAPVGHKVVPNKYRDRAAIQRQRAIEAEAERARAQALLTEDDEDDEEDFDDEDEDELVFEDDEEDEPVVVRKTAKKTVKKPVAKKSKKKVTKKARRR